MTYFVICLLGICCVYQLYRFIKAEMTWFTIAYSIAIILLLSGFAFGWPSIVRLPLTAVTMAILLLGSYSLKKNDLLVAAREKIKHP